MSIQEQIAPYLNRFVLLFNQDATAKLEIGCSGGKVSVNISHDIGAVVKTAPTYQPEKQKYSDVLKKSVRPSQLKRLKKRADARAETIKEKETAEKALEDEHVSEVQKVEAAKANFETHGVEAEVEKAMAIAEAEKAISNNAYKMRCAEAEKAKTEASNPIIVQNKGSSEMEHDDAIRNNFNNTEKQTQTLRCSICRKIFPGNTEFNEHKKDWNCMTSVKCPLCAVELLSCEVVMKHLRKEHKRNFNWIAT